MVFLDFFILFFMGKILKKKFFILNTNGLSPLFAFFSLALLLIDLLLCWNECSKTIRIKLRYQILTALKNAVLDIVQL